ncbi:Pkinase-domain-containing protein [Wolfiporia cocos MD-104 SS10]|uniref:Pkinase-domain-containing protein n=1 Tax=Wolfiporia cocos (strain MD-104) TaxID=742152 RepID=A0A2H3JIP5_WOLCO|nr:Pkinase-domain-containing protein [Wolfiporia cocos MD-104 SS10]
MAHFTAQDTPVNQPYLPLQDMQAIDVDEEPVFLNGSPPYDTQSTQEATQEASQYDMSVDSHLWGYFIPCSQSVHRVDFSKTKSQYQFGRAGDKSGENNDIVFHGKKISNKHCIIVWDGKEDKSSAVKVTDLSSNGTFVNGVRIGKNKSWLLYDGNEIAFGSPVPNYADNGAEDYRFVFRRVTGTPLVGFHAQYQMHNELGKGSFAVVMKAIHRETGHWYAVKVMQRNRLRHVDDGTTENQKFDREISILQRLDHPNICQLKDVFHEPHTINLVLEYISGGDLLDYIVRRGYIPERETKDLTWQLCDAIAYIHSQGIAHRDLKPENVLLTEDVPPRLKVADFGLAKVIDSMTMLRTMCGTPCYLAPEVVLQGQGDKQLGYDKLVDSWSIGVIVFSMLTGISPFRDDNTDGDMVERVQSRQVEWSTLERMASRGAKVFIQRLLDMEPKNRLTPAAARSHKWLEVQNLRARAEGRERTVTPEPEPLPDLSMRSFTPDAGDAMEEDPDMFDPYGEHSEAYAAFGGAFVAPPSQPIAMPGAYPLSQQSRATEGSRLMRRAEVLLSQSQEEQAAAEEEDPTTPTATHVELYGEDDEGTVMQIRIAGGVKRRRKTRSSEIIGEGSAARVRGMKAEAPPARNPRRSSRLNASPQVKRARRG